MSRPPMSTIEIARIGYVEVSHECPEVTKRGFDEEMKMVIHKNIAVENYTVCMKGLKENFQKMLTVTIIFEYIFPFIAATRHMIDCIGVLYS